jgi:hypothetical protein
MTRGTRLAIVFCLFLGVILMMMDCAKKTMRKKQQGGGADHGGQGWLVPDEALPSFAAPCTGLEDGAGAAAPRGG